MRNVISNTTSAEAKRKYRIEIALTANSTWRRLARSVNVGFLEGHVCYAALPRIEESARFVAPGTENCD